MFTRAASTTALVLGATIWLTFPATARAQSVIKQPGNHADYAFELEPHLALQWADREGADDGIGPGIRANIPLGHNGPIPTINNNMAIGFGMDITFGSTLGCYPVGRRIDGRDCNVTEFWMPVVWQWNFYLTPIISVFGEPGLAIVHRRWSYPWYCNGGNQPVCNEHFSDTGVEPVFAGGGRFQFGSRVGLTVRIGFPMLTVGANILF